MVEVVSDGGVNAGVLDHRRGQGGGTVHPSVNTRGQGDPAVGNDSVPRCTDLGLKRRKSLVRK